MVSININKEKILKKVGKFFIPICVGVGAIATYISDQAKEKKIDELIEKVDTITSNNEEES